MNDSVLNVADRVALLVNALHPDRDHPPVVKLFTPDGNATWLISESDPDDPDRLFGLCDLGLGFPELGFVSLLEIQSVRGKLGLPSSAISLSWGISRCQLMWKRQGWQVGLWPNA